MSRVKSSDVWIILVDRGMHEHHSPLHRNKSKLSVGCQSCLGVVSEVVTHLIQKQCHLRASAYASPLSRNQPTVF